MQKMTEEIQLKNVRFGLFLVLTVSASINFQ